MLYEELSEAHERDSTRVPDLLVGCQLAASPDKATVAVSEVVFARHVVGGSIQKHTHSKVAPIAHEERPHTVSEFRADLGFLQLLLWVH